MDAIYFIMMIFLITSPLAIVIIYGTLFYDNIKHNYCQAAYINYNKLLLLQRIYNSERTLEAYNDFYNFKYAVLRVLSKTFIEDISWFTKQRLNKVIHKILATNIDDTLFKHTTGALYEQNVQKDISSKAISSKAH